MLVNSKLVEDITMLKILLARAERLLDLEDEVPAFKKTVLVPANHDGTRTYRARNAKYSELLRTMKDIRRESLNIEKRLRVMNR